jgi:hypothetical protein
LSHHLAAWNVGAAFWQADIRLSRRFRLRRARLEVLGEIFNVTNRRNWIGHNGNRSSSSQFGKPTAATGAARSNWDFEWSTNEALPQSVEHVVVLSTAPAGLRPCA